MTSSPPPHPEATHFNGKALSPTSPTPIHIPEPSSIPILQNQIDPVFNLMSTHMDHSPAARDLMTETKHDHDHTPSVIFTSTGWAEANNQFADDANDPGDRESEEEGNNDYGMIDVDKQEDLKEKQDSDILHNHSSSSAVHLSTSIAANETSAPSTSNYGQKPLEDPLHYMTPSEPSQDPTKPRSPSTTTHETTEKMDVYMQQSDTDVVDGGVNYDALLDNLSPPTATAPTAESIVSITTSTPTDASNAAKPSSGETPIAAIPLPAGLPPRPPPQEKPAIHPNYTPGEDIRSYHYLQTQNTTAHKSYTSQPNNSYRPTQDFPPPASGATVGANGLPPPPLATFQQPSSKDLQSQRSPIISQHRNRDGHGKNSEKSTMAMDQEEDEVPWTPDIEKKYAEFLVNEAVYVTEGLWDRFPPGSRLFVGKSTMISSSIVSACS